MRICVCKTNAGLVPAFFMGWYNHGVHCVNVVFYFLREFARLLIFVILVG